MSTVFVTGANGFTGFSELIDEGTAKGIGIREFVTKPLVMHTFARKVRSALDGAQASGAAR